MAASGHFRLLDLPRELRDIIYEYVLTEKAGLVVLRSSPSRVRPLDDPYGPDPNRLKLVCHQLYQETTGLGLRYNKLTFGGSFGFDLFTKFTEKHCSRAHFGRVRTVVIMLLSRYRLCLELQAAHAIGKEYPALSVEVQCCWMTELGCFDQWRLRGSEIQYAVRGTFPSLATAAIKDVAGRIGFAIEDGPKTEYKNVRVFPESFNKEALWLSAINSERRYADDWITLFEKWSIEGF